MGHIRLKSIAKSIIYRGKYILRAASSKALPSRQEATDILMNYSPDPQTSPLRQNNIHEKRYDLTVIVPVYQVEKFLSACMSSILNQKTKYSFCVVAVNDGSTDASGDILNSFSEDSRLQIVTVPNQGVAAARNIGLQDIYSPYLMFVDSDDILVDHAIEALLDKAYTSQADIVQGGYEIFDNDTGKRIALRQYQNSDNVSPNGVLAGMPCGKVYRSELFSSIVFPEGYIMEDTIVTAIVTHLAGRISTISNTVYRYRHHSQSITRTAMKNPKAIHTWWVTECVLTARKELGLVTDDRFYEHLLRQVVLNYQRTVNLPANVQKAMFVLTKHMLQEERPESYAHRIPKYAKLEKAVYQGKYEKYRMLCGLW